MAWERRSKGDYYYHKVREGGRVVSHYVGKGAGARFVAALAEGQREIRALAKLEAALWLEELAAEDALDQELDAYGKHVGELVTLALVASGFHRPKRQWRVRRNGK